MKNGRIKLADKIEKHLETSGLPIDSLVRIRLIRVRDQLFGPKKLSYRSKLILKCEGLLLDSDDITIL